ncbi:MAG TPA: hypothetical protein VFE47_07485 [Tepidisphaeraceae bacterium]|nr:hypothetical protein [Tepidisphaeraceae bacterium]
MKSRLPIRPGFPILYRSDYRAIFFYDITMTSEGDNEAAYEAVEYDSPKVILSRLAKLEEEIEKGRKELEGMLK